MPYATRLLLILTSASIQNEVRRQIEELWEGQREALEKIVLRFVLAEIFPATMFDFETQIAEQVRELARQLLQRVLNGLEAQDPQRMPHDVQEGTGGYRRLNQKTRNAHVSTLLGTIELWRYPYRYWQRDVPEACIFPLEIALGLVHGATPALVEAVGRYMAQAGATQQSVLHRLRSQHGVCWGVHPRTGEKLHWIRIVDYYHAAQRIWTMAEALFGKDATAGRAWARRMCRVLKKPGGPFRVLHSAAALRKRRKKLSKSRMGEFRKAYQYIRRRTKLMQYHDYKRLHLPIGSGVTEAACKTIVTQRLKLSGMRWMKQGAQTILNLRVVFLSGIWQPLYRKLLDTHNTTNVRTYGPLPKIATRKVA